MSEKKEAIPSCTKVNVKNVSTKNLNLANGTIKAGAEGIATLAELQGFEKYLTETGGEVPLNASEKKAIKRAESLAKTRAKAEAPKPKAVTPTKAG